MPDEYSGRSLSLSLFLFFLSLFIIFALNVRAADANWFRQVRPEWYSARCIRDIAHDARIHTITYGITPPLSMICRLVVCRQCDEPVMIVTATGTVA